MEESFDTVIFTDSVDNRPVFRPCGSNAPSSTGPRVPPIDTGITPNVYRAQNYFGFAQKAICASYPHNGQFVDLSTRFTCEG